MPASFKTFIFSTAVVLTTCTGFSALAQSPATPAAPDAPAQNQRKPGKAMKALDTNNDSLISREEAKSKASLSNNFDAIDTNKDGQLSRSEMKAFRQAHKGTFKDPAKN